MSRSRRLSHVRCWLLAAWSLGASRGAFAAEFITLEQAYDRTLRADQAIQRAYWEIRKARLEPLSALTRLAPSITGSAGLNRSNQNNRSTTTETTFAEPTVLGGVGTSSSRQVTRTVSTRNDTGSTGLSYQQTVLDLTVIPAFRLGKLTAQAARLTYRSTIRETLYGLAQAYYEVLKQQRIVVVAHQTLNLAEQQLELARNRADVGEVTRADVLRAQVTVEGDRQTLIEAENTLLSKRNLLANILNLPDGAAFSVVEPAPAPATSADFPLLFARAMAHREDLRVKSIAIDQDVQRRNGVWAEYAPKVVAQLNADRNSISGSSDARNHSWDASLAVQVPFFTGGQREIDLAQAGYQIRQTQLDYDSFLENVQQDVKDAWLRVRTLEGTLKAVRVRVEAARQAYEDISSQYQAGTATSVDVLSALNDLNAAQRDLATQTYDLQVALCNVQQVTGVFQEQRVERLKFK